MSAILDGVELSPFRIERFYARYEHSTRFMLSSSDCESRTIGALLEFEPDAHERLLGTWCGYTESPGGPELRQAIAAIYERTGAEVRGIDLNGVVDDETRAALNRAFVEHHVLM